MAGPRPTDEQDQASTCCTQMGTTREEEERQVTGHIAENGGEGDGSERQDLGGDPPPRARPRRLEKIYWRLMLQPE